MIKKSLKLRREQMAKLTEIEFNSKDWELLRLFFIGTRLMSGTKYPSIGICYHAIWKIKSFCTKETSDEQIKKMKKMLFDKLSKYFQNYCDQWKHLQVRFQF